MVVVTENGRCSGAFVPTVSQCLLRRLFCKVNINKTVQNGARSQTASFATLQRKCSPSIRLKSHHFGKFQGLGLNPLGEDTGTADVLSRLIIEREDTNIPPLFFPCGSIKREVLPTALRESGVPLETLTVYQTAEHPDLEKNLKNYFTEQGRPASIAFFSPSGVKFCLDVVRRLSGEQLNQIKFGAIGPTTRDAMTAEGLSVSCSAEKPTAEHLAAAIAKALQEPSTGS